MYVTFSHFPQSTSKFCFDRFQWSTNDVIWLSPYPFLPDSKLGRSGKWILGTQWRWIHPTHCFTSFFPHLSLKEHNTVLHLVQFITSSIKVTNKTIFTHDCLISGHYKQRLRSKWSDFFVSVILDEVLMCALSHRVGQLRLLCVMRLMCAQ